MKHFVKPTLFGLTFGFFILILYTKHDTIYYKKLLRKCHLDSPKDHHNVTFPKNIKWKNVQKDNENVKLGGIWEPDECIPDQRMAIIIPYRDRSTHLMYFLDYMHPFLQRQKLSYRIFVIEQKRPFLFNKASLMNIGFKIASELDEQLECFIFHDVDIFPENDQILYKCSKDDQEVMHFSDFVDKYNYTTVFILNGGALAVTKELFKKVNGYSNLYWGWGGEDNNLVQRFKDNNITIHRCKNSTNCKYTMIKHVRDAGNPTNHNQNKIIKVLEKEDPVYFKHDGLTTLNFTLHKIKEFPLFTWVYVSLDASTYNRSLVDIRQDGKHIAKDQVYEKIPQIFHFKVKT
ncbi:unnamed protein product [Owenia fusiformis]|uniref:Beta-1,4-galactosyltransferase n=1 Tax=Owenia fusiformis TaxID=6347 RepID=A0A8J1UZE2_OWEFU|nr:unnamed protein product [Owenia fusiformis]